jgi:hypothetical protein
VGVKVRLLSAVNVTLPELAFVPVSLKRTSQPV